MLVQYPNLGDINEAHPNVLTQDLMIGDTARPHALANWGAPCEQFGLKD